MSGSWTWPPTSTLHLFPESVLTVFLLLLQLRAKIHWIEMNKHWLPDKLMLKEWLMNIADAMHSNWKILLSFDAKAHPHTHALTHSFSLSDEPQRLPGNIPGMNHSRPGSRWWPFTSVNFPQLLSAMQSDVDSTLCVTQYPDRSAPTWTHTPTE